MFLICFRSRRGRLTQVPCATPKRHPRPSSGDMATCPFSSIRALPSEPSVSSPCWRDFRPPALSRWSAHGVPPPLVTTRLRYGDVSLAPLRALRRSLSTLWRPHAHVVSPPLPCLQPWPLRPDLSMHFWSARKIQLHLSLSPPHFELLPTLQGDAHQASRTMTKSTVGSSHTLPSRC